MQPKWHFLSSDPSLRDTALQFLQRWENNLNFSIHSSGTTGDPQLHTFEKDQLIQSAQASITALDLKYQTRALLCLPLTSVGGLMLMARSLVADFDLFLTTPTSRPLKDLSVSIDFIAMVPTQLQQSLTHDLQQLKKISKILVGGGALSAEQVLACQKAQLEVWQSYGMTETLSHVALRKVSPTETPYFEALPGITFSQENDCLCIHYPHLYPNGLRTKDLVQLHNSTQFTWLGRADHAINSGGFKIIPEFLEAKLAPYFSIPFFITGLADPKWGERVVIVFETTSKPDVSVLNTLQLPAAEKPRQYACIPHFERTDTQKIRRNAILQKLNHDDWRSL